VGGSAVVFLLAKHSTTTSSLSARNFSGVVFQLRETGRFFDVTSTSVQDLGPSNVTSVPEPGVLALFALVSR